MSRKDQFWEEDEENAQMSEEQAEAILEASQKEESVAESEEYAEVDDEEIALTEEEAEEADQAYDASVMADARLRLEQGRLYEMLLEHSLFKDVDADARAIKNVEREIKAYIRERLEILVGLKVDKAKQVSGNAGQFTDLEVDMLKQLIGRVLKKEGISPVQAPPTSKDRAKPVQSISPLQGNKPAPTRPVTTSQKAPVKVPVKAAPVPAKKVVEKPLAKSPRDMTARELAEFAKRRQSNYKVADGGNTVKRLPMPDAGQRSAHLSNMHSGANTSTSGMNMNKILGAIGANPGIQDVGNPADY